MKPSAGCCHKKAFSQVHLAVIINKNDSLIIPSAKGFFGGDGET
jgi:hypothetical protein